jgi:hypothetical protein
MTETIDTAQPEALRLLQWYDEDGFAQGTKAPSKWVLQAAAELRNLHAANVYNSDLCAQALDEVRRLTSALAAAEARNATLTDDAARLDFMCNKPARFIDMEDGGWWRVYEDQAPPEEPHAQWRAIVTKHEQTPRAAIDAAMQTRAAASISTNPAGDAHADTR